LHFASLRCLTSCTRYWYPPGKLFVGHYPTHTLSSLHHPRCERRRRLLPAQSKLTTASLVYPDSFFVVAPRLVSLHGAWLRCRTSRAPCLVSAAQ